VLVSLGLVGQVAAVVWLKRGFDVRQILANYRTVMRLNAVSASALSLYLLARLALTI
jgi:hypothetical protein